VIDLCQSGAIDRTQRGPLENEARKHLVKAYARTPGAGPDKAWDFFRRMGASGAPRMLEMLAELYWEQGIPVSQRQRSDRATRCTDRSPTGPRTGSSLNHKRAADQQVALAGLGI
jgi:hypothetical protein